MANEAVIVSLQPGANPVQFTVADGAGIEKGTIMQISSDPNTITATSGDGDKIAGIAATEKVASDGQTRLGCWVPGQNNIFDLTCAADGATLGVMCRVSGANLIRDAQAGDAEAGQMLGQVLETGSASEVVLVKV